MTGTGSSCGACKFLRRKCIVECVFAPYFCYEQAATHFAAVHKVFGASNVSKLLSHLPYDSRSEAAITISYEALARVQDPIYGCVSHIIALQQQVISLQKEIEVLGNQMLNSTVGFLSSGSSQSINSQSNMLHLSTQCNDIHMQEYLNQQTSKPSHTGFTADSREIDCQLSTPPLHDLGNCPVQLVGNLEGMSDDSESVSIERLLREMDQQISLWYPLLDNEGNIEMYEVSS